MTKKARSNKKRHPRRARKPKRRSERIKPTHPPAITAAAVAATEELPAFARRVAEELAAGAAKPVAAPETAPEAAPPAAEAMVEREAPAPLEPSPYRRRVVEEALGEEGSPWLEVRPYIGQELRVANYIDAISVMHGIDGAFEFLMASGPDPSEVGRAPAPRRVVRYFVRCPDDASKELVKNVLMNSGFDVAERPVRFEGNRLLWWEPDVRVEYPAEAELELCAHYGEAPLFPASMTYERSFEQFIRVIDNLHAALLSGGALRVAVRREDKARIYVKAPGATRDLSGAGGVATYHASNFVRGLLTLGRPDGTGEETRRPVPQVDWRALEEHARRVSQSWFVCDARAYGTAEQIRGIAASLVFPTNRFRVRRLRREIGEPMPELREARLKARRAITLLPLALPLALWRLGAWNPLDVMRSFASAWPLPLALLLPLLLRAAWKPRGTIAMTAGELSLLVSLPNKPEAGHFYFAEGKPRVEIREKL